MALPRLNLALAVALALTVCAAAGGQKPPPAAEQLEVFPHLEVDPPGPAPAEEPQPAPKPPADPTVSCPWAEYIEDDEPVASLKKNSAEYNAYTWFVLMARQVSADDIARHVNEKLSFPNLFGVERGIFRGEIVRGKGRLKRLRWIGPTQALKAEGVKDLYEAWVFDPAYDGNPYCVVVTELPEGLKPAEEMDRWVSFEAFFFKRYKYQTAETVERQGQKRPVFRLAPLLIGRTLRLEAAPPAPANPNLSFSDSFVRGAVASVLALMAIVAGVTWWLRREDRRTRSRLSAARNPYAPVPSELTETPPEPLRRAGPFDD
jgi:hypothetical protein